MARQAMRDFLRKKVLRKTENQAKKYKHSYIQDAPIVDRSQHQYFNDQVLLRCSETDSYSSLPSIPIHPEQKSHNIALQDDH